MMDLSVKSMTSVPQDTYDRYGFAMIDLDSGRAYDVGHSDEFEAASSIKSILATLAITQAMENGVDPSIYKMHVDGRHAAPGAATILGNYREAIDEYVTEDNRSLGGKDEASKRLHALAGYQPNAGWARQASGVTARTTRIGRALRHY